MDSIIPHTRWCDARDKVLRLFERGPNVVGLFGPPGTGKTLLLHELSRVFRDRGHKNSLFERGDILPECVDEEIILIDEAHRAASATLAKLGQQRSRFIIFATIPSVDKDWQTALGDISRIELSAIFFDDIKMFISARLAQREQSSELISSEAIEKLAILSEGVPRVLDNLMKLSFFSASLEGLNQVDAAHVEEAAVLLNIEKSDVKQDHEPKTTSLERTHAEPGENNNHAITQKKPSHLADSKNIISDNSEIKENRKEAIIVKKFLDNQKLSNKKIRNSFLIFFLFIIICVTLELLFALSAARPFVTVFMLHKLRKSPSSLFAETKFPPITAGGKSHDTLDILAVSPGPRQINVQPVPSVPAVPPNDSLSATPNANLPPIDASSTGLAVANPAIAVMAGEAPRSNIKQLPAINAEGGASVESHPGSSPDWLFSLSTTTPIRVVISYPRGNLKAAARAAEIARTLTTMGFLAEDPIPVLNRIAQPEINFFFVQDRDGAMEISHKFASEFGQPRLIVLSPRSAIPRPGTVEIFVAERE